MCVTHLAESQEAPHEGFAVDLELRLGLRLLHPLLLPLPLLLLLLLLLQLLQLMVVLHVATAAPRSNKRDCISMSCSLRPLSLLLQYSRATPMVAHNSSCSPKAWNTWSVFVRRSPLYKEEVPLSPVFVYIMAFL